MANVFWRSEADLTIIPVLNKIDLPASDVERVSAEVINLLGCDESDIIKISAKTGQGVDEVLTAVVERIPAKPKGEPIAGTRALIFDSYYDDYRGVILYTRELLTVRLNGVIRLRCLELARAWFGARSWCIEPRYATKPINRDW